MLSAEDATRLVLLENDVLALDGDFEFIVRYNPPFTSERDWQNYSAQLINRANYARGF
jgi:hypothetical protein